VKTVADDYLLRFLDVKYKSKVFGGSVGLQYALVAKEEYVKALEVNEMSKRRFFVGCES